MPVADPEDIRTIKSYRGGTSRAAPLAERKRYLLAFRSRFIRRFVHRLSSFVQSSSASRFTAGAAGFFILSQSGDRPFEASLSLDRPRIFLRRTDHALTEVSDQPLRGRICVRLEYPRIASEMLEHAVLSAAL